MRNALSYLPTDDELWEDRKTFSYSTWALGYCVSVDSVLDALTKRKWGFNRKAHHRLLDRAPCRTCGKQYAIDEHPKRECPKCRPKVVRVRQQWEVDLEYGRKRNAAWRARKQ